MNEDIKDLLRTFVRDIDEVVGELNAHELDMDGFSQAVNNLIDVLTPKIVAAAVKAE